MGSGKAHAGRVGGGKLNSEGLKDEVLIDDGFVQTYHREPQTDTDTDIDTHPHTKCCNKATSVGREQATVPTVDRSN